MALTGRQEAFRVDTIAAGFDHTRSQWVTAFGHYVANSATTFQAGMLVDMNSDGEIIKSVGAAPFGWTKYNKTSSFYGVVVGEYIQLIDTTPAELDHPNVRSATLVGVRVAPELTGTAKVEGDDYTMSYANGTVTRIDGGGSSITDGDYVYVNYQYALTVQEVQDNGHNFWNFSDDVTIQGGKVTVITGNAMIFTTAYDSSETFTIGATLYAGTTGQLLEGFVSATVGGGGGVIGTVMQLPTADDPFLGVKSTF